MKKNILILVIILGFFYAQENQTNSYESDFLRVELVSDLVHSNVLISKVIKSKVFNINNLNINIATNFITKEGSLFTIDFLLYKDYIIPISTKLYGKINFGTSYRSTASSFYSDLDGFQILTGLSLGYKINSNFNITAKYIILTGSKYSPSSVGIGIGYQF